MEIRRALQGLRLPVVAAHRGASDRALENSLAAISLAVADRADMMELDVRLSADGDAVVIHDARTGRTGRENVVVAESSSERLRRVRLKNGERLPFLADALDIVRGAVPVNVHVKTKGGMAAVRGSISATGYRGALFLSSGLRAECLAARSLFPDVPCGLVTGRPSSSDIAFCVRHSLPVILPDHRKLSLLRARKVKAAGLIMIPYAVDDPELFFRLVEGGAAGVISNRAESLRIAWRERNPAAGM